MKIRTRNYSAKPLKNCIVTKFRTVLRLGSTTPTENIFPNGVRKGKKIIEINTAESCKTSADKLLMKICFDDYGVKTAKWSEVTEDSVASWIDFPAIVKKRNSSKGNGIFYIESSDVLREKYASGELNNCIIEKYHNYSKEYRLHVTKNGCFLADRKMLREGAGDRWHRHANNSVWISSTNELFEEPSNMEEIINHCVKALKSVGLDVGACDVKVQSEKNKDRGGNPEFIILEINSAPSLGEVSAARYKEELIKIIESKENDKLQ